MTNKEIILGAGCFWCTQAVFDEIKGVVYTEVGYSGGKPNPSYESVINGDGNIEVAKIIYDEKQISLEKILEIFLKMHDPTSLDKQGADEGTQYRSVIFYQTNEELKIISNFLQKAQKYYAKAIVTQVLKLEKFYKAENYHQKYFKNNPSQAYCRFVIAPKLEKVNC
ncbi:MULTISPECIES: peptide-methionine (S)-S-oxide reductase MsrA [Campylobacter]|uniref:Peptide methionine sulfoxide reductase MsrA n=1 Tax=Campylobacter lari TaxID=201 RepID=K0J8C6_CAMLA|nr:MULTISPECIES: peptide-methionine (S)-S-oxide reductase MsrA [Campylobacter]EAI8624558.1 peptide-methionine (S)-S-oxide reductase MsrA [Campylobacter lari]EAK1248906.1 peptide-methionine (S)-S-oxide reductase MsrA [Campylobacter lari]EGK8036909.1 peptide-methionine (S)-S-oxide reductase MsrA [Campylobacter lari]EGK8088843.1 peptide-methionine (S)-S-oxide reductase MsrA [Campylobacter lari]MBX1935240.1 peptide-methionine (S)-S-oxide reductase MsrA [Campylobacter lari]